jgi:type IV pilus assembly protein PilE
MVQPGNWRKTGDGMAIDKQDGFTLIELMITTAIVAILAAVAYPSYTKYIVRSNRTAAQAQMLDIANRQQQFLLANRAYAAYPDLQTSGYSLPSALSSMYTPSIAVGSSTVPAFTITFTPITGTRQDGDGPLTFTSEGVKGCGAGCDPSTKW